MSGLSVSAYFPWSRVKVVAQDVNDEPRSALVHIEPDQRYRPRCHACQGSARTVHSHTRRFVRDLDFGGHEMWLQIEYRKVWCDTCGGVRVEQLEFADVSQRVTHRLTRYVAELCKRKLSITAVADHVGLDPKTVKAIDKATLEAEFGETCYEGLRRLAIDEIALKKGQNHYMTVALDFDTGRVVWMGCGHGADALAPFFRDMPPEIRDQIEAVAIDMWDPYIKAIRHWCPQADIADIVFDLFHVVQAFNRVIDDIRNEEFRQANQSGRETLKGSKYLFLKNWGNLRREQRIRLKDYPGHERTTEHLVLAQGPPEAHLELLASRMGR